MLYIIRGLPGSGKTTLAKIMQQQLNAAHFEADMFFEVNGEYKFDKTKIKQAHNWCYNSVIDNLLTGKTVIVSNTFTRYWEMQKYIDYCTQHNVAYHVIICSGNYKSIHNVPNSTIEDMKKRFEFEPPKVNVDRFLPERKNDTNKPRCIIVDIDGTLAMNKSGRSPYDESLVHLDVVNEHVKAVVNAYTGKVIIVSGRTQACDIATQQWLRDNGIAFHSLYMRQINDSRKDAIVKKEIFEQISQHYFVEFAIDDRKQVKRMWNEVGVFVFDVNQFDVEF